MRFVTYSTSSSPNPRIGVVVGDEVKDLASSLAGVIDVPDRLIDYIAAGPDLHASVVAAQDRIATAPSVGGLTKTPPSAGLWDPDLPVRPFRM